VARVLVGTAFAAVAAAPPVGACDSTGCLMLTRGFGGVLPKGGWNVDFSYRYADQSQPLSGREPTDFVSRPRVDRARGLLIANYHRDIDGVDRGFQLEAGWGAGARSTVYVSAPVLSLKSHEIGHAALVTDYDTWGFGDVVVGARQSIALPFAGSAMLGLGLKLPTGETSLIDSFDNQPLDPVLQPGTGSWDLLFSGLYTRSFSSPRLDVTLQGSYQANTTNDHHYRFGNEAIASLGLSRPLGSSFALSAQAKWMHEGRDRFRGLDVPSSGSSYVYLTAGLRFFRGAFSYYAVAQLPVYRYVNEAQLAPRAGLVAGVSRSFQ
jgi:hypothetical protein